MLIPLFSFNQSEPKLYFPPPISRLREPEGSSNSLFLNIADTCLREVFSLVIACEGTSLSISALTGGTTSISVLTGGTTSISALMGGVSIGVIGEGAAIGSPVSNSTLDICSGSVPIGGGEVGSGVEGRVSSGRGSCLYRKLSSSLPTGVSTGVRAVVPRRSVRGGGRR